MDTNSILIYDIESATKGSRPDGTKDEFRIFGCYSYLTGKYHILTKPRLIKQMIDQHKFLVGFNNKEYDNKILFRMPVIADSDARTPYERYDKTLYQGMYISKNGKCGFSNKITIDLMEIFKKRAGSMKIKKGMLGDLLMKFSLSYIAKTIELGSYKDDDFDYGLLAEPVPQWSPEKLKKIVDYTKQDLLVTKEMYEWLEEYFGAFKDFVSQENIDNKSYLTCSTAVLTYKAICNSLNIKEEYDDTKQEQSFLGGYVSYPAGDSFEGDIYCLDFNCLPEGELVHTLNGYKKIEDIKIGDTTISMDLKHNKFVDKRVKQVNDLVEIELKDGVILKQTPEHRIPTNNGLKLAKDITIEDKLLFPTQTSIRQNGKYNELYEFLGIFICEGSLFRQKRFLKDKQHPKGRNSTMSQTHLSVKFHETDFKKHIEYLVKKYVPYDMKFKVYKKHCKTEIIYFFNMYNTKKEVYDWFYNFKEKYYSIEKITKNKQRVKAFLTGVFKSDATWNICRNSITLCTSDKKRFNIICKCLSILGIKYTSIKDKRSYNARNIYYRIEIINSNSIDNIFKWFKWNSYRDDKFTRLNKSYDIQKIQEISIRNINHIKGNFKVYDLTMERQESPYFIHNGYFTHNSLYPHILMMCNVTEYCENGWKGNGKFKVNGSYNDKVLGEIPKLYIEMYNQRVEYKKRGDPREYAQKIFLNSGYGILNNPAFKNVYQPIGGAEIPFLGRQFIQLARTKFQEAGYMNLANDTDSCYIMDPYNDKERMLKVKDQIIKEIKDNVPFPVDHFDMGIDDEISNMWFVKNDKKITSEDDCYDEEDRINKQKNMLKKNYAYLTKSGEFKYKNLNIKKKSVSALSRTLFREILIPEIKLKKSMRFSKEFIDEKISMLLNRDIDLAAIRYSVKDASEYKVEHQIQAQIARRYGPGIKFLVPNKKLGVGKAKKYCLLEEFKELGLGLKDLDLSGVYKELKYFIVSPEGDTVKKKRSRKRPVFDGENLGEWF